jgi:hypothetical protein
MTSEQMTAVLGYITNRVSTNGGTAPVTLSIGYVDASNIVQHNGIRITDAAEAITTGVIEYVKRLRDKPGERYIGVSLHRGALHIS